MIVPEAHEERTERLRRALRRWRGVARAVLLFERVWPALWPSLGLLGLFICAALLNRGRTTLRRRRQTRHPDRP